MSEWRRMQFLKFQLFLRVMIIFHTIMLILNWGIF